MKLVLNPYSATANFRPPFPPPPFRIHPVWGKSPGSLYSKRELNFFRIHILVFTLLPIVSAGVFTASNGEFRVMYIDALFLCIRVLDLQRLN
ncbi:hypothetical protein B0F90DRAFT_1735164 [Multifurca ochricompacta]|uniref:Uncharacterized protein n=1 Tax=Multifurca ochricompacta TaxID=376703 RepID=A0AAD4M1R6_9AGAM|nr:hypothetical protein B0F90DRAFT_1735164 [Multifurca ochricompacta]